ncbi:MAG: FAD binding domain-containing protein [Flavobacteriales bacterium]|nr:FAD binding domain-containing protein [Flavobacteriales bacterium]
MDFEVISATTTDELFSAIADNQNKEFKIGAGFTDLINQFRHRTVEGLTVINISQLRDPEYKGIVEEEGSFRIGTLTTASNVMDNQQIKANFPVLHKAASKLASTQIRNVATLGGNICNVSPSGDMTAALIALRAVCNIIDYTGKERSELLSSFITGLKQTSLKKGEIIKNISIPKNTSVKIHSGFEKIGSRNSMEIAIVSLSYHIQCDENATIKKAGVSCGAVAPTIPFATSACEYLVGKSLTGLTHTDKEEFAQRVVQYATPISDIRASAWYRKEVLFNISKTIFD